MDSGGAGKGGQQSWANWELGKWSAAAGVASSSTASANYGVTNYAMPSSSSHSPACFPFPDQPVVPQFSNIRDHFQFSNHSENQQQYHHHLTCLKLGKRPYCEEGMSASAAVGAKRPLVGSAVGSTTTAVAPRCQVEGCGMALGDAKEYHRRHKVCEAHSKAPKVVVLGAEQRFCQQCSRFHVISEFDDFKRSCRRRLAGHNERRRKSSTDSNLRNPSLESTILGGKSPYVSSTSPGSALSLLSYKAYPWVPTPDLASRSSAALRELIAENRAALLARQLFSDRSWHSMAQEGPAVVPCVHRQDQVPLPAAAQLADGWNQTQVTLDLMQMPGSSLEILPGRSESKDEEEDCCEIWKSLAGTHVQ